MCTSCRLAIAQLQGEAPCSPLSSNSPSSWDCFRKLVGFPCSCVIHLEIVFVCGIGQGRDSFLPCGCTVVPGPFLERLVCSALRYLAPLLQAHRLHLGESLSGPAVPIPYLYDYRDRFHSLLPPPWTPYPSAQSGKEPGHPAWAQPSSREPRPFRPRQMPAAWIAPILSPSLLGWAPQLGSPEGTFLCCQDKIHQSFPIYSRLGLSQHHEHTGPDSDHRDRFCSVLLGNSQLLAARLKTQKPRSLLSLNQLSAPQV